jgi:hypothetical protein
MTARKANAKALMALTHQAAEQIEGRKLAVSKMEAANG